VDEDTEPPTEEVEEATDPATRRTEEPSPQPVSSPPSPVSCSEVEAVSLRPVEVAARFSAVSNVMKVHIWRNSVRIRTLFRQM